MGSYKYDKANTKFFGMKLNLVTDKDLIELLEAQENVQSFLKTILRMAAKQKAREYPPTRYNETLYVCGVCCSELTGKPHYCGNCGHAIKWTK